MPLPASKCFMALVVSVLCAVSPRITVDTSLISLCTSKNRELRKLTTPVRSGGGSGRGAFSSRSSKVKSIPMVTYPIWFIMFIFLYFTFVKKWTLGHFKFHFVDSYRNWLIVQVQMVIFFQTVFLCNISIPKLLKNSRTFGSAGPALAYVAWRRKIEQWNKLGRRWTWCLTIFICKGWRVGRLS